MSQNEQTNSSNGNNAGGKKELAGDIRLSLGTKFSYASGDIACNIVFGTIGAVLTLFYTDYVGIDGAVVALIMLICRCFDGFSDLIMGFIVERTKSKWGQSRPWVLWMSFPFAISCVLLFTVPQVSQDLEMLRYIYVFVTYFFCSVICYTAVNLPYGSLSSMMTRNAKERQGLSIIRMGMSPIGKIIAVTATTPIVINLLGNNQTGWIIIMIVWAVVAELLLLLCFFKCKENVVVPGREEGKEQKATPILTGLKALFRNQYFWAVLILWMIQSVAFSVSGTAGQYYTKYVLSGNVETWKATLLLWQVDAATLQSVLVDIEIITMVIFIFLCAPVIRKFGKRNTALVGAGIAILGQFTLLINPMDVNIVMLTCVLRGIGMAPLNAVVFAMVGDAVEFGQWKSHIRQEGLVFAGGSVGTKVGAGIASAAIPALLTFAGFQTSTGGFIAQNPATIQMISNIYFIGPLIIAILAFVTLLLYRLDKKYDKIVAELAVREANGEL